MKKFVVAIDSFKGSLTSMQAGTAACRAIQDALPNAAVRVFPVADGGEGTVDALTEGLRGRIVTTEVTGPLGKIIKSRYGLLPDRTAVIEMADAAGLTMVPKSQRNPLYTTTYGLGELILEAAEIGCRHFIIGIGGSATNDCGLGMLSALGARFYRADGTPAGFYGRDLHDIETVDFRRLAPVLKSCTFEIACDVTNPLCGENGCSAVFGPQKGATPEIVARMDADICRFAGLVERACDTFGMRAPGAGAAGGLGFAFRVVLGGQLTPGIDLILRAIHIEDALKTADYLITGEGRLDAQTAMGKAPVGIARLAHRVKPRITTIAVCGCAAPEAAAVNHAGIDAYFPIIQTPMSVEEAMEPSTAVRSLQRTVTQIARLIDAVTY